jgi:hypothetical protein
LQFVATVPLGPERGRSPGDSTAAPAVDAFPEDVRPTDQYANEDP